MLLLCCQSAMFALVPTATTAKTRASLKLAAGVVLKSLHSMYSQVISCRFLPTNLWKLICDD